RVLAHIEQVGPLLREHEDVIAVVQAGFIGAWGEWHSSTHGLDGDPDARATILGALLDAMPSSRSTQLRYPPYKEAIYGSPLAEAEAWRGDHESRVGHHNDCFVSSETDVGTYPDGEVERWTAYLAEDTRFVPMGGETCAVFPARSDCDFAPGEMERLHFSFINRDYHPDVVGGWADGGCMDVIERHLGYRIVLLYAELPEDPDPSAIVVRLRLRNDGWAAPFNPRVPHLVVHGPSGTTAQPVDSEDARRWLPGREVALTATIRPAAPLSAGSHSVALWLPDSSPRLRDRPDYAIRTADDSRWDATQGWNVLGEIVVP
ncbi:MAG: DUF4832 domain-containing protein, partial [Deltaproteobacteria bacterium]|nr:DUF4832 domain-containing protein [Deltaproteobacteria bacterium]